MDEKMIQDRIEQLRKEKEEYIAQANRTIAYMDGQIDLLQSLLNGAFTPPAVEQNIGQE